MTSVEPPTTPRPATGPQLPDLAQAAVARWVQQRLAEQPWYKRKANTITTLGGALSTVLGFVLTSAVGLPQWGTYTISSVLLVLTVLGVNNTKNGVTPQTGKDLQDAVTDPVVLETLAAQLAQALGNVDVEKQLDAVKNAFEDRFGKHRTK